MSGDRYAIDASALMDARKSYPMTLKAFSHVWERFSELVNSGNLVSSVEIYEEIQDEDLLAWAKKHKSCFLPLTKSIQQRTAEILERHPDIIRIRSRNGSSNGDPFLIATAIEEGCIVVSNEKRKDNQIPGVCEKNGIDCITLEKFLGCIFE